MQEINLVMEQEKCQKQRFNDYIINQQFQIEIVKY